MKPIRDLVGRLTAGRRDVLRGSSRLESAAGTQEVQTLLRLHYQALGRSGVAPTWRDVGFRRYSQFEEDGILLMIFSIIGEQSRTVVEICCGDGQQSMSANLIINHGWNGLLFEGDAVRVASAERFFARQPSCVLNQPTIRQAWITAESVNSLIKDAGRAGQVDLLSLDLDGNDYWVWKALDQISPRVCVLETHNVIPSHLALTIPYDPEFTVQIPDFHSASLLAMSKLSRQKGYRLIGGHRLGFNAFFMRDDVAPDLFPEVSVESVHDNHFTRVSQAARWPRVEGRGWQQV